MIIYNLFPRVSGKITEWEYHLGHIQEMGFTHIYINPIFEIGYSKSLYAPKNFKKIDEMFIDTFSEKDGFEQLAEFVKKAHEKGLKVIFEMIFTHTAIDSELLIEHSDWYKYENNEIKKFSFKENDRWQEWGDLIELDNELNGKKNGLWEYWHEILELYIGIGADGFKCEAAYKVPQELWKYLISSARKTKPEVEFIADNLGAGFSEMLDLTGAGFDYMFTSLKWWDFNSTWFLEQHYKLKELVKLISFPESSETGRLADSYNGNEAASKAWYGFASFFNTGTMIPIGYEYGCRNRLDVINSFEEDLNEKTMDISEYVKSINSLKKEYKLFSCESDIYFINSSNPKIFIFKKVAPDKSEESLIIVNRNYEAEEKICFGDLSCLFDKKNLLDISPGKEKNSINKEYNCTLTPGEIKVIYGKE